MKSIITASPLSPPDIAIEPLSNLLAYMRAMYFLHHTVHITVRGPSFGEDHALVGAMYEQIVEEIDQLAEKLVAYYDRRAVNLAVHTALVADYGRSWWSALTNGIGFDDLISGDSNRRALSVALSAEEGLIEAATDIMSLVKANGTMPMELDDWLMGLCNAHGPHIYKLKARLRT